MTLKKWRGQSSTATVYEVATDDEVELGVLDEVTVTAPEQEVQELRGTGSTEWVDVQKTETAAGVSGTWSAVAIDAWDDLIDWDEAAGIMDDSAEVKLFEAEVELVASDGSTKVITVGPGYIDGSVELSSSREEWVGAQFDLRAQTIDDITNTDASA